MDTHWQTNCGELNKKGSPLLQNSPIHIWTQGIICLIFKYAVLNLCSTVFFFFPADSHLMLPPKMSHLSTRKKSGEVLTSYLGLLDQQISPLILLRRESVMGWQEVNKWPYWFMGECKKRGEKGVSVCRVLKSEFFVFNKYHINFCRLFKAKAILVEEQ